MAELINTQNQTFSSTAKRTRVLIVDDEEMIRSLAEKILKRAGLSTIAVSSGSAAVEAMRVWGEETTLAIVDYSMSGMTGVETIQELQKIAPHLTFVVSSGHILGHEDLPGDFTAEVHFLQKPYRANQLSELALSLISK
ncbi:MAG: response regulator [Candidatus Zixiibacteriota bacterium]